ncbi:hypothetical protein ACFFU9_10355 [Mariniflexile ostreae]|uniref:Uncharacterized protein n=1 Tax=Mariniflexile ostreae TaxID=1520892 RepID=A0ABV5FDF9_9FLAO
MKKRKKEEDQDIKDNEMFLDRALEIIDDNAKLNESSFLHSLSYDYIFDFDFYQNLINSLMCLQSNLEMDLGENKKNILKNLFLINRITLITPIRKFLNIS